jgi:hypothetical protein
VLGGQKRPAKGNARVPLRRPICMNDADAGSRTWFCLLIRRTGGLSPPAVNGGDHTVPAGPRPPFRSLLRAKSPRCNSARLRAESNTAPSCSLSLSNRGRSSRYRRTEYFAAVGLTGYGQFKKDNIGHAVGVASYLISTTPVQTCGRDQSFCEASCKADMSCFNSATMFRSLRFSACENASRLITLPPGLPWLCSGNRDFAFGVFNSHGKLIAVLSFVVHSSQRRGATGAPALR